MSFRLVSFVVLGILLAFPSAGHACAACLDLTSENRLAFVQTAVALSLLPFGLVGGLGLWLRRKMRSGEGAEDLEGRGERIEFERDPDSRH